MDEQTLKNPANVLMLAEAREEVETLLKSGPIAGASSGTKLEQRSTHQYFVVRGEEQSSVLCAARTDTTNKLELKDFRVSKDFTYTEKKNAVTKRSATSRALVAEVTFKQSVGHLGDTVTFMAAHGNMRTRNLRK